MFLRMGLVRRPPDADEFANGNSLSLSGMLRSWSYKQVSKQFEALRKAGLINGARDSNNAPWRYELPEELTISSLTFSSLPFVDELFPDKGSAVSVRIPRTVRA